MWHYSQQIGDRYLSNFIVVTCHTGVYFKQVLDYDSADICSFHLVGNQSNYAGKLESMVFYCT